MLNFVWVDSLRKFSLKFFGTIRLVNVVRIYITLQLFNGPHRISAPRLDSNAIPTAIYTYAFRVDQPIRHVSVKQKWKKTEVGNPGRWPTQSSEMRLTQHPHYIGFILHDFPGLRQKLVNLVIMFQYCHRLCKLPNHLLMHCHMYR